MGSDLLSWMKASRETVYFNFADTAAFIQSEFGDNIEEILNGVQERVDHQLEGHVLLANAHKPALIEAMRQWFAEIHRTHASLAYERFAANIVRSGDTVITFNYDIALDSKLQQCGKWSVGDGYGFRAEGLPAGSSVRILKLHGSINWLATLFGGTEGPSCFLGEGLFGRRPAFGSDDLAALGYSNLLDPRLREGSVAVPPLILPTSRKNFFFQTNLGPAWMGFWNRLWTDARTVLECSNRIVICGYGMYAIDQRGRDLLLQGDLAAEFEVCCGADSDRIVQELRQRGRSANPSTQRFFEDWVAVQA